MEEVDNALWRVQIAIENETEVSLARLEELEGVSDRLAKHYVGMLDMTESTEQSAERLARSKIRHDKILQSLDKIDQSVSRYERLAEEISLWCTELEKNVH